MSRFSSKSLLYFFVASLFSVLAQSFLLAPHRQQILLQNFTAHQAEIFAFFLLISAHWVLSLSFFQYRAPSEKIVLGVALISLGILIWIYARAALWVEVLILLFSAGSTLSILLAASLPDDWFGIGSSLLNAVVGILILFPSFWQTTPSYQRLFSVHLFLGTLFFFTAFLKLYLRARNQRLIKDFSNHTLALPWIGWAFLFSLGAPQWTLLIPAFLLIVALLVFGLLPLDYFRLPDNKILGHSAFPSLSIFFSFVVAAFAFLRQQFPSLNFIGDFLFLISLSFGSFALYALMRLHYLIHALTVHSLSDAKSGKKDIAFNRLVKYLFAPFEELQPLSEWQAKKIQRLSEQLIVERENSKRFDILNVLRDQLDHYNEESVVAQLVVNIVAKYFNAALVLVLLHDIENRELYLYAIEGNLKNLVPSDYRQSVDAGIMGRAARLEKVQVVNDTSQDRDYIKLKDEKIGSELFVPLIEHGNLRGMLMVAIRKKNAFSAFDVRVLETVAHELIKAWQRISYSHRMRALIQSNISLSSSLEPYTAVEEIATVARATLLARVVFVALLDQDGAFTRTSSLGHAPRLLKYLSQDLMDNPILGVALRTQDVLRIRDINRYKEIPPPPLDYAFLRGVLMVPIRLHGINIGAIIAFGKENTIIFSEKDEALADLLASQAAAALESAWLIQELRVNANTTNLLYNLSIQVIQTDTIREAARLIAETAQKLTQSKLIGVVLFSNDNTVSTAIELGANGQLSMSKTIPLQFVEQTLTAGEAITMSAGENAAVIYLPIQTSLRKYGVVWIEFVDSERKIAAQTQSLKTLANQAAMVLERAMLLVDLRDQAEALKNALDALEQTYDQTLSALMAALDARDRETEGHSSRVGELACLIADAMKLDAERVGILRRGALLHDIGKIGVSDTILHKPGPLSPDEWRLMRRHPEIGARIVEGIPFLAKTMPVIRYHHERWNGSGYPHGLSGEQIPLEARIFAVADVFDALTSVRPYRQTSSDKEAFDYLEKNAGILFDPEIVAVLSTLLKNDAIEKIRTK